MSDNGSMHDGIDRAKGTGELPRRTPDKLWGGPSTGALCAICGIPTSSGSVELELEFAADDDGAATTHRVHPHCFSLFTVEIDRSGGGEEPSAVGASPPGAFVQEDSSGEA